LEKVVSCLPSLHLERVCSRREEGKGGERYIGGLFDCLLCVFFSYKEKKKKGWGGAAGSDVALTRHHRVR